MSFICPNCADPDLEIETRFELPADARSDEISLILVRCGTCAFQGVSVYEESRRGSLDCESWERYSFAVRLPVYEGLAEAIGRCPAPNDRQCPCRTHVTLAYADASGRWIGVDPIKGAAFELVDGE